MAELCFHHLVHFDFVPIYIFGFHHKQCASDQKDSTFVKFISQLFSCADESLKDETRLLLRSDMVRQQWWHTAHIVFKYIYIPKNLHRELTSFRFISNFKNNRKPGNYKYSDTRCQVCQNYLNEINKFTLSNGRVWEFAEKLTATQSMPYII